MKDVDLKKLGTLRLCGGGALVALATWGVWAFCGGGFSASGDLASAFDGWKYGREDQKAASAALAAAGLDEWSWDDGRLLVPKNKKNEYQTALAEAGAYPKAPSESRRDAIREMSAFESETKTRMRELDACARQLEGTLERTEGIEYATVGVRSRREKAGLTTKTVVTASIGVACREGRELDAGLLSAITVAAKHQLGVDSNENISILDLKVGKSYFGSETLVGNGEELTLAAEKERVETYWRDKLLKTFDYMGGVRVSVAAELVAVAPDEAVGTELGDVWSDGDAELKAANAQNARVASEAAKVARNERATFAAERLAQVKVEGMGEIESPRPLAAWSGVGEKNARNGGAFARLGNPVATRSAAPVEALNLAEVERRTATSGAGVLSVGAIERRGGSKSAVVPAGYREDAGNADAENEENKENEENGEEGGNERVERVAQTAKGEAVRGEETVARLEAVEQGAEKRESGESARDGKNGGNKSGGKEGKGKRSVENAERVSFRVRALAVRIGTPRGYVRRVAQNLKAENAVETFANDETAGSWGDLYRTTEQKIIAETKSVALVLLRPLAERNGWSENELVRSVAVDVFADPNDFEATTIGVKTAARRDGERGSVVGNVGSVGNGDRGAEEKGSNGAYEAVANFGQFANISEMVAEETTVDFATAEQGEGTTPETLEEERAALDFWTLCKARVQGLDAETKTSVGVAGVGVLTILLVAVGATTARRRKKKTGDGVERDVADGREGERSEGKKKSNPSKRPETQDGENKGNSENNKNSRNRQNRREGRSARSEKSQGDKRNKENRRNEERGWNGTSAVVEDDFDDWRELDDFVAGAVSQNAGEGRNRGQRPDGESLRIVRVGEKAAFAQDLQNAQNVQNTRRLQNAQDSRNWPVSQDLQGLQNERNPQIRPFAPATRPGSANGSWNDLQGTEKFGAQTDETSDFDDFDDLDDDLLEIRALIERERARVGGSTAETNGASETAKLAGDATRRREALDFVARDPDRAAASLRRWLRPGA